MVSKEYALNNYRIKKFNNKYLITSDTGSWIFISKDELRSLKENRFEDDSLLFNALIEKGFVTGPKNIDKLVDKTKKRLSFLFHGPSLHIIIPTLRCNMDCIYCHASSRPACEKGYDMSIGTAKKVVDFIFRSKSDILTIEFQGGEPLLNFSIIKYIVGYSKNLNKRCKKDLRLVVVTNLTSMNKEKMSYLIKNDVGICTSLDGPSKVHNKNRHFQNKKGSYNAVIKWVKDINKSYKKNNIKGNVLGALITVTKNSLPYYKEIIDEYIKQGFNDVHLRFLHNLGDARPSWKSISYTSEEFIEFWKKSLDYIISLNKKGIRIRERMVTLILKKILNDFDPGYLDLRSPCGAAIGQIVYDYDGSIYTCDEGRMVGNDIFKIGDVKKDKFEKVLASNQTSSIVLASINDQSCCEICVYKPYCGICPVCNYAEQGNIIGKIPETNRCKIFKAEFDYVFDKLANDKEAKNIFLGWI